MRPDTEQIFANLEVITPALSGFNLPGHEDGASIYPFVWETSENGEFNILNLCRYNGWLKQTDVEITIRKWQQLEYLNYFPDFDWNPNIWKIIRDQLELLSNFLKNNSQVLESFCFNCETYRINFELPGTIVCQLNDESWICICPTYYKETEIKKEQFERSPNNKSISKTFTAETLTLISKIQAIIPDMVTIHLEGDFGGGYDYSYDHKFVFAAAETKELAIEEALQASGML